MLTVPIFGLHSFCHGIQGRRVCRTAMMLSGRPRVRKDANFFFVCRLAFHHSPRTLRHATSLSSSQLVAVGRGHDLVVCIKPKVWNLLPMTPIEALRYVRRWVALPRDVSSYRSRPSITEHAARGRKTKRILTCLVSGAR